MEPEVNEVQPMTPEQYQARITELETKLKETTEQLATADELLALADEKPPVVESAYKLSNTNPSKVAFIATDVRPAFTKYILPIIIAHLDEFYQGNGKNTTIGQDAMIFQTPAGDKLSVSMSCNHWTAGANVKGNGKVANADSPELIRVTPQELARVDAALITAKANKDIDTAVRLATIKSLAKQQDNRLVFDDLVVVKGLKG